MKEEWRPIPGWESSEVSNLGRIRSVTRPAFIRKPYVGKWGHLWIAIREPGKSRSISIHRAVALAFIGPAPSPVHQAAHNDGNPSNNVVSNIRWATHSENQMDRVAHGTSNRGTRQHLAKLSPEKVLQIRVLYAAGWGSQQEIARRFGVARSTILAIVSGRSWYWLSDEASAA